MDDAAGGLMLLGVETDDDDVIRCQYCCVAERMAVYQMQLGPAAVMITVNIHKAFECFCKDCFAMNFRAHADLFSANFLYIREIVINEYDKQQQELQVHNKSKYHKILNKSSFN